MLCQGSHPTKHFLTQPNPPPPLPEPGPIPLDFKNNFCLRRDWMCILFLSMMTTIPGKMMHLSLSSQMIRTQCTRGTFLPHLHSFTTTHLFTRMFSLTATFTFTRGWTYTCKRVHCPHWIFAQPDALHLWPAVSSVRGAQAEQGSPDPYGM